MAGRIRPLLFWFGRDDVGLARITWRRGEDGAVGYELLVGTDPARAPRAVNRWGYVAEEARGRDGATLALMSRSDETSLGDVQTHLDNGAPGGDFRALVASLEGGAAHWQVASVRTAGRPTVHDLPDLLGQVHAQTASAAVRSARLASDVRPGFLGAVAELVDRTVAASRGGATGRLAGVVVPYTFGQGLYELRQSSLRVVQAPPAPRRAAGGSRTPPSRSARWRRKRARASR